MSRAPAAGSPAASCTNEAALKERSASHGNREAMEWKVCVSQKAHLEKSGAGGRRQPAHRPRRRCRRCAPANLPPEDSGSPRSPNPSLPPQEGDESGKGCSDKERARDRQPVSTASLLLGPRRREAVQQPVPLTLRAPLRRRGGARRSCEGEESTARVELLPPAAVVGPKQPRVVTWTTVSSQPPLSRVNRS